MVPVASDYHPIVTSDIQYENKIYQIEEVRGPDILILAQSFSNVKFCHFAFEILLQSKCPNIEPSDFFDLYYRLQNSQQAVCCTFCFSFPK